MTELLTVPKSTSLSVVSISMTMSKLFFISGSDSLRGPESGLIMPESILLSNELIISLRFTNSKLERSQKYDEKSESSAENEYYFPNR
jgi:hypothetical protein